MCQHSFYYYLLQLVHCINQKIYHFAFITSGSFIKCKVYLNNLFISKHISKVFAFKIRNKHVALRNNVQLQNYQLVIDKRHFNGTEPT